MNTELRQRIVGALVLVALGVVFLPMLLDLGGSYEIDTSSRIPPAPTIEPVQITRAKNPTTIPPAKEQIFALEREAVEIKPETVETKPEAPPPVKPSADSGVKEPRLSEKGLPEAWVLQVGSFKDQANAKELNERLIKAGFQAFVRTASVDTGQNYRVFVGPKVLKDKILADQRAIEKKFAIKSWLVKFEP